jgi:small subunit ribosomal protein S17
MDNRLLVKKTILKGFVVKKQVKTATILTCKKVKHPKYKKFFNKLSKYMIHDEKNICNIKDFVVVKSSRPYSSKKKWILYKII